MSATHLRLKFDANQAHQLRAVESVVRLFEGLPRFDETFRLGDDAVANLPPDQVLSDGWLLDNLRAVQRDNGLSESNQLERDYGLGLAGVEDRSFSVPHFTIEMETGTGKTYVYLRTIYALRKHYGWSKFVIVVPSLAIYEGVVKNVQVTRDHFRALYDNEPFDLIAYDGAQISRLRAFASTSTITVLLITLDAFNKPTNNLYKLSEKLPGERKPFEYVQATRPVLILDEPQNMESERAKQALRTLNPLLALRYSATHRTHPNLVYRLSPVEAFQRGLVKRIEVWGVTERDNPNVEFLTLQAITPPPRITAQVRARVTDKQGTREETLTLRQGDDLFAHTGREEHRGYVVENINAAEGYVEFANGERLYLLEGSGQARVAVFREQIRQTLLRHMERQQALHSQGIKVLSLFFIDRVANYTDADGLIRRLFDEEYARLAPSYPFFAQHPAEAVRQAYFAHMRRKDGSEEAVDTEGRTAEERQAEKRAFELIMRDKERLLSLSEPVSFIFAHSALKEGWDNPNVFQICTLNQTRSEVKKRQEIGRGLRLCVNQAGERVHDEAINVLTVIANESYDDYALRLQQEYVEDGDMPPLPTNVRLRQEAKRRDEIFCSEDFQRFWEQLNRRVRYRVHVDTAALIDECVARLNQRSYPGHVLVVERGRITPGTWRVEVEWIKPDRARLKLTLFDQQGEPEEISRVVHMGEDLSRTLKDERLRSLGTVVIETAGKGRYIVFTQPGLRLAEGEAHEYTPEGFGGQVRERFVHVQLDRFPVFNLIDRAAKQTGLTRPTINAIFKRMRADKKRFLLHNPEGFANVFIAELRNALADHIAERIEFVVEPGDGAFDKQALFPPRRAFPQKETLEAGPKGLYDLVQKDSDVEARYVEAIKEEGDAIAFYFKFPPGFKVSLPALIGDYNPDWGIARVHRNGKLEVRAFVHETKGSTEISRLQFPHERRKIRCAQRYFAALGIAYRAINPEQRGGWWQVSAEQLTFDSPSSLSA
ncbi:MAG: DEAD/DEAH box helicase family protein [Anaerolineae bacterium]|nr:DEAD/DEAH box helicase family protein [Anaerolineae bacterium]